MSDDSMYAVGRRVASKRVLRGLGQHMLAVAVGVDRSHITRIELGQRHLPPWLAAKIAATLGTTPEYLLTGEEADSAR